MAKKLFIRTYGCQMNVYDSARMADVLAPLGYQPSESPDDADMVIVNTCHIREHASEKVFSELGRLRESLGGQRQSAGALGRLSVKFLRGQQPIGHPAGIDLVGTIAQRLTD